MASGPRLTHDGERLIARHVDSVGVFDLLMLLRSEPDRAWACDAVCAELKCPPAWAERELERLCGAGLAAVTDGGYRYAPESARMRVAVDSLARAWRRDRAAVTQLIFAARRRGSRSDA